MNHRHQTFDFVQAKEREYLAKTHRVMGIWEAMEFLNTLVDDSDPDTELPQIEHCCKPPRRFAATAIPAGSS